MDSQVSEAPAQPSVDLTGRVLGEYVVRIYDQVRNRPKFIVSRNVHFAANPIAESNAEHEMVETLADVAALRAIVETASCWGLEDSSPATQPLGA